MKCLQLQHHIRSLQVLECRFHYGHDNCQLTFSTMTACMDPYIRLCDLRSGASTHTLIGHENTIACCRWSPTNEYVLASSSYDKTIRLWDIRKAKSHLATLQYWTHPSSESYSHMSEVYGLAFYPDGQRLLSVGADQRMIEWSIPHHRRTPKHFDVLPAARLDHFTRCPVITDLQFAQSMYAFQCVNGNHILVYELGSGRLLTRLKGHFQKVNAVAWRGSDKFVSSPHLYFPDPFTQCICFS